MGLDTIPATSRFAGGKLTAMFAVSEQAADTYSICEGEAPRDDLTGPHGRAGRERSVHPAQ